MKTPDYPIRTLPFLTDFSTQDRQLAEKAFRQQEERRRKAHESRTQKADEAVEGLRRRLQDLLGAKRLAELRAQITRERLTFADLWQPPEGLDRDYAKSKKASKLKVDALFHKLGASPEKLRPIRSEFRERLEAALLLDDGKVTAGYNLRKNLQKWTGLSPQHKFPLPWGTPELPAAPPDPHRWFVFRPPFFGFLFRFDHQTSNSHVDRLLFLNPAAGLVGNEVATVCNDGGFVFVSAEAQIAFGFEPPTAGLVEVLIDAQSTIGTHHVQIDDEFLFRMHRAVNATLS